MKKIIIDGHDITEHVAAMYDAIVGSMDWGSDFLDTEAIVSIMLVGRLAGFDVPLPSNMRSFQVPHIPGEDWPETNKRRRAAWQAQIDAMIQAAIEDAKQSSDEDEAEHDREALLSTGDWDNGTIESQLAKYRTAGWEAVLIPDSRDGDYIRLRRK